jgi:hypothetical protein
MTYSPGLADVAPSMVSSFTFGWSAAASEAVQTNVPGSSGYEGANKAIYYPILVPTTCVIRRVWWANGDTVSASYNIDVGVYATSGYAPGARLVSSGSTAQGTASQVQFVDVTDTVLSPGQYWLAVTCSSVSATLFRASGYGAAVDAALRFQEASALPLPATATPVESDSINHYLFGFATTASP